MRRFPFYAYPNSFYASPAEASFHRSSRPFSNPASSPSPRPSPTPRSVSNVPVFDSAPSRPSSLPAQPITAMDPSAAATAIQSHFRGFSVRRHHPLLQLRSISSARKQLEELQTKLERPDYVLKVRESDKERLRFNESVMAIILRLDAIEGSMAEVRSQRKEATKMAIKLQDAIDAIVMQKEGIVALDLTANVGDMASSKGDMAPSEDSTLLEHSQKPICPEFDMVQGDAVSANGIVDVTAKHACPDDNVAENSTANLANNNAVEAVSVSLLHKDTDQQGAARLGCVESHILCVKTVINTDQNISNLKEGSGDGEAFQAAKEEDAVQQSKEGIDRERRSDTNGVVANDDVNADAGSVSTVKTLYTPQEKAVLHQLSEDCRQLKSLVGKLLLQNKAQSDVLCALAQRLEILEHREHRKCGQEQRNVHVKRKLKKGSKRRMKCGNWEFY